MSVYRFLQDAYIGRIFPAGTVASTVDVGGLLPTAWVPGPYADPLDFNAVNAFYAAVPHSRGLHASPRSPRRIGSSAFRNRRTRG